MIFESHPLSTSLSTLLMRLNYTDIRKRVSDKATQYQAGAGEQRAGNMSVVRTNEVVDEIRARISAIVIPNNDSVPILSESTAS